jgi:hypothetical protein
MPRSAVAYRRIASRLLSERGIAAVWQLHLNALSAHLNGYAGAADLMLAIADAAEEVVWWRTQVSEVPSATCSCSDIAPRAKAMQTRVRCIA